MVLFDFLRPIPEWAKRLPPHLQLSRDQIRCLDAVRRQFRVNEDEFLMHILSHPETTRRVQRHVLDLMKGQMPEASEGEIVKLFLASRVMPLIGSGFDVFGLAAIIDDEKRFEARLDQIMSEHPDSASLIEAIVIELQRCGPVSPTASGYEEAERRVGEILAQE